MSDQNLFQIDSITVDGVPLAFVSGTARIDGVARYTSQVVPSGSGPDFTSHTRVPTMIIAQIQFGRATNPADLKKINGARIVLKDSQAPRRALAPNCSFGSMGSIGSGPVDVTFNVLEEIQWI